MNAYKNIVAIFLTVESLVLIEKTLYVDSKVEKRPYALLDANDCAREDGSIKENVSLTSLANREGL
jgi:hypothetical protein